jgi:uncharacterized protein YuzE
MKDLLKYSKSVDALYLSLREDEVEDTREIRPGVMVDYNSTGEVIGVEILDFMERLKQQSGPSVALEGGNVGAENGREPDELVVDTAHQKCTS